MAYTPLFQTTDTLAANTTLSSGATTATLTSGNFGTPTGVQLYVVDYGIPGTAEIISATVAGTAMTGITRGLAGGAASTTNHVAGATVGSLWVPQFLGNGLGAIAANDAWTTYAPTTTAAGTMTITGVTYAVARFQQIGKNVNLQVLGVGTTGGVAATSIYVTLPSGLPFKNSANTSTGGGAFVTDTGGSGGGGYWVNLDGTHIQFSKYNSTSFGLGASVFFGSSFTYETA
jgi:hypothetical protein